MRWGQTVPLILNSLEVLNVNIVILWILVFYHEVKWNFFFSSDCMLRQQLEFYKHFGNIKACTSLYHVPPFLQWHWRFRVPLKTQFTAELGILMAEVRHKHLNTSVIISRSTLLDEQFFCNLFPVFINKIEVVGRLKCLLLCQPRRSWGLWCWGLEAP